MTSRERSFSRSSTRSSSFSCARRKRRRTLRFRCSTRSARPSLSQAKRPKRTRRWTKRCSATTSPSQTSRATTFRRRRSTCSLPTSSVHAERSRLRLLCLQVLRSQCVTGTSRSRPPSRSLLLLLSLEPSTWVVSFLQDLREGSTFSTASAVCPCETSRKAATSARVRTPSTSKG